MEAPLTADDLSAGLKTQRVGRKIQAYAETGSTMDVAHRLAAAGEPEGTVVFAEAQNKGRGRLGRSWASPKGTGVYLSLVLRPQLPLAELPKITLMTAVAVAKAIQEETGLKPEIKWPNDLLLSGKKLAGILTELGRTETPYIVIGIGLNVNTPAESLPETGTSLAQQLGKPVDRLRFARRLLAELDAAYAEFLAGGMPAILESWREFAGFLGGRIRVSLNGRLLEGQALDVDPSGALLVRTENGLVQSVASGEIQIVE